MITTHIGVIVYSAMFTLAVYLINRSRKREPDYEAFVSVAAVFLVLALLVFWMWVIDVKHEAQHRELRADVNVLMEGGE